jgi:hypothetical protein
VSSSRPFRLGSRDVAWDADCPIFDRAGPFRESLQLVKRCPYCQAYAVEQIAFEHQSARATARDFAADRLVGPGPAISHSSSRRRFSFATVIVRRSASISAAVPFSAAR